MRDTLGQFEFQVLATLQAQPDDAYGVTIGDRLSERTGKTPSAGALYTTLDRLQEKGFVTSWWGEPTAERGGRRKRMFRISAAGVSAMRRTEAVYQSADNFGGGLAPQGA